MLDSELDSQNLEANVLLETNDYTTIRSMASVGLGWTCLPEFQIDDTLTALDIDSFKLQYTVALIYRKDLSLSRAAQVFIETL